MIIYQFMILSDSYLHALPTEAFIFKLLYKL